MNMVGSPLCPQVSSACPFGLPTFSSKPHSKAWDNVSFLNTVPLARVLAELWMSTLLPQYFCQLMFFEGSFQCLRVHQQWLQSPAGSLGKTTSGDNTVARGHFYFRFQSGSFVQNENSPLDSSKGGEPSTPRWKGKVRPEVYKVPCPDLSTR